MVRTMQKYNVSAFQLKKSAEDEYNNWLHKKLDNTVWNGGCKSWYRLPNGKVVATVCASTNAVKALSVSADSVCVTYSGLAHIATSGGSRSNLTSLIICKLEAEKG